MFLFNIRNGFRFVKKMLGKFRIFKFALQDLNYKQKQEFGRGCGSSDFFRQFLGLSKIKFTLAEIHKKLSTKISRTRSTTKFSRFFRFIGFLLMFLIQIIKNSPKMFKNF